MQKRVMPTLAMFAIIRRWAVGELETVGATFLFLDMFQPFLDIVGPQILGTNRMHKTHDRECTEF